MVYKRVENTFVAWFNPIGHQNWHNLFTVILWGHTVSVLRSYGNLILLFLSGFFVTLLPFVGKKSRGKFQVRSFSPLFAWTGVALTLFLLLQSGVAVENVFWWLLAITYIQLQNENYKFLTQPFFFVYLQLF